MSISVEVPEVRIQLDGEVTPPPIEPPWRPTWSPPRGSSPSRPPPPPLLMVYLGKILSTVEVQRHATSIGVKLIDMAVLANAAPNPPLGATDPTSGAEDSPAPRLSLVPGEHQPGPTQPSYRPLLFRWIKPDEAEELVNSRRPPRVSESADSGGAAGGLSPDTSRSSSERGSVNSDLPPLVEVDIQLDSGGDRSRGSSLQPTDSRARASSFSSMASMDRGEGSNDAAVPAAGALVDLPWLTRCPRTLAEGSSGSRSGTPATRLPRGTTPAAAPAATAKVVVHVSPLQLAADLDWMPAWGAVMASFGAGTVPGAKGQGELIFDAINALPGRRSRLLVKAERSFHPPAEESAARATTVATEIHVGDVRIAAGRGLDTRALLQGQHRAPWYHELDQDPLFSLELGLGNPALVIETGAIEARPLAPKDAKDVAALLGRVERGMRLGVSEAEAAREVERAESWLLFSRVAVQVPRLRASVSPSFPFSSRGSSIPVLSLGLSMQMGLGVNPADLLVPLLDMGLETGPVEVDVSPALLDSLAGLAAHVAPSQGAPVEPFSPRVGSGALWDSSPALSDQLDNLTTGRPGT